MTNGKPPALTSAGGSYNRYSIDNSYHRLFMKKFYNFIIGL